MLQAGAGNSVCFLRRGWDYGVHGALQNMFEEEGFLDAVKSAFHVDATNPHDLASGSYFSSVDRLTGCYWSKRQSPNGAGMYSLGEYVNAHPIAVCLSRSAL